MATYGYIGWADLISSVYSTTGRDPIFTDRSVLVGGYDEAILRTTVVGNDKWFHFTYWDDVTGGNTATSTDLTDSADVVLFAITPVGGNPTIFYRNSGSLVAGPILPVNSTRLYTIDIHIRTGNGTGLFELFINETIFFSVSGLSNGTNNVKQLTLRGQNLSNTFGMVYSEMLVGEDAISPTVGRRVSSRNPTGLSAVNTAWVGTVSDLTNNSFISNGAYIRTGAAGNREGFTFPNVLTTAVNCDVEAVQINSRGMDTASTGFDYGHTVRIAGVNYDQAALGVTLIPTRYQTTLYLNPATGANWLLADVNAAEWGLISI